jgi:hypothetical protein
MSNEIKVSDSEALEWANQLNADDKAELRRQALLKRALELAQPEPAPDVSTMSDAEFTRYKRSLGIG